MNGSDADGGCPQECVGEASGIRRCDCMGTSSEGTITGVLIDGTIPTIDTSQRGNWASQLFTVPVNAISYALGFRFKSRVALQEVELYVLHCPAWQIGATTINVYDSTTYPSFTRTVPIVGSVNLTSTMQNCESLTRVSIPLQTTLRVSSYFIEFTNPMLIGRLHIAEVRFSDQPIATDIPTDPISEPSSGNHDSQYAIGMIGSLSILIDTESSTLYNSTSISDSSTEDSPSRQTQTTTVSYNSTIDATDTSSSSMATIGALVGVVVILLMLLLITGGVVITGCYMTKTKKKYQTQVQHLQDVVSESNSTKMTTQNNKSDFELNLRSQSSQVLSPDRVTPAITNYNINSKLNENTQENDRLLIKNYHDTNIRQETSDIYDDISPKELNEDDYSTIADSVKQKGSTKSKCTSTITPDMKKRNVYSLVQKEDAPPVPKKTPELYRHLNIESLVDKGESVEEEYYTEVKDKSVVKVTMNPIQTSVSNTGDDDQKESGYYSIITEDAKEHLSEELHFEVCEKANSTKKFSMSGPVVLSKPVCRGLERNPNYQSTDEIQMIGGDYSEIEGEESLQNTELNTNGIITQGTSGIPVLTNPICKYMDRNPDYLSTEEVLDDTEDTNKEDIYDIVYSEPINPSMFTKNVETQKEEKTKVSILEGMFEDSTEIYFAPIYSAPLEQGNHPKLLQLKSDNIKKVKTLGTGFFGKVVLANTVGLSLKDLKMSDTDDDKSKSIRVAVKLLKQNLSASRREEFDKELRFMSRLDHPNVIRTLGACNTDTPFVMMEYMENGDLNQYLQEFDSIIEDNDQPGSFKISTGTLTNMSTQIANAMKYLASRNFIHRDLATRNCLVGQDHQIKIADFGMSRNLYESHYYVLKGHTVLPVRWMAKECFYGKFSAKTDVWAFGVTMWEIFTLSKDIPYEDMDDIEVVANATENTESRMLLEKPGSCPQEVYEVMLMCWAEKPKDRATFERLQDVLSLLTLK